jgi:preprotein translocase SecE subunit
LQKSLFDRLAVASLAGVVYVLGSIGIVFYGLPALWDATVFLWLPQFVAGALLLVAMIAAVVGLAYFGARLAGPQPPPGLRAGIVLGVLGVVLIGLIALSVGHLIQKAGWVTSPTVGIPLTVAVGVALLVVAVRGLLTPTGEKWLRLIEDQGWFGTSAYKKSQGLRVRRGTMLGILILAGCGVYTLLAHKTLEAGPTNWAPGLPFTDYAIASWKVVGPFPKQDDKQYPPEKGLPETEEQWATVTYPGVDNKPVKWETAETGEGGFLDFQHALKTPAGDVVAFAYAEIPSRWDRDAKLVIATPGPYVVWLNGKKIQEVRRPPRDEPWRPGQTLNVKLDKGTNRLLIRFAPSEAPDPAAREWLLRAEVAPGKAFVLLPHVRFTVPLLLAALALWFAWRVVNFAPFADFLIATEAELNKVSWTTRKRLVQDTIVVLVTVILLTVFLFFIDVLWGWILSSDYIRVLMVDQDVEEYIEKYDKNHDGYLDKEELPISNFDDWDTNHDGKLDKKEVKRMLREMNAKDQTTPW